MLMAAIEDWPSRPVEDQLNFFRDVRDLALKAQAASGLESYDLDIAGTVVRLCFAGPALAEALLPAVAHRIVHEAASPDVTIHVWDSESTGVAICDPPFRQNCISERGDIWTFDHPRIKSAFHLSEYSLNLLHLDSREGVFWVRNCHAMPYWTLASPFRTLFHWWMTESGGLLLHAAAVGTEDGGVLITGKGGAGKSTTALSCLRDGFLFCGDDFIAVTGGPEPVAHSLYRTAKLNPDNVAAFADLPCKVQQAPGGSSGTKAVLWLDAQSSGETGLSRSIPIKAVATPRFADSRETSIEPVERTKLLGACSYTSLALLPHSGPASVERIERLLDAVPGYTMAIGHDVQKVPTALRAFLKSIPILPTPPLCLEPQDKPLISVIIPVFNAAHFVAEAVQSVLAQGYPKLEIIIVDDGSTDNIAAAVAALPVQVRFLRCFHGGPSAARNVGIRASTAEYVAFLDVDDLWTSGYLDAALAFAEDHPDADVVLARAQIVRQRSNGDMEYLGSPAEAFPFCIGASFHRRRSFTKNGMFDPGLRYGEDTDWFLRTKTRNVEVKRLDAITLLKRRHDANMTKDREAQLDVPLKLARNWLKARRARMD